MYYSGDWGTVCDNGWDLNDAQVVCNELGYNNALAATHNSLYGQGHGRKIRLDNVQCVGTEWTIGNCTHKGWNSRYCYSNTDAGVKCATG